MLELDSKEEGVGARDLSAMRGILGYSAAISLDKVGKRMLGERGAIEGVIAFRHEGGVGDLIMLDAAMRAPVGRLDVEARVQYKAFLDGAMYRHAPGADLIFRLRAWPFLHLFSSTFAEFLVAERPEQDAFFFRNLTGVVVPARAGDIFVFAAADVGHGKGALVDRTEASLGGGVRVAIE
jgi:hypothetical protein